MLNHVKRSIVRMCKLRSGSVDNEVYFWNCMGVWVFSKRHMHVETQQMNESKFDLLLGWHVRPMHVSNILSTKQFINKSNGNPQKMDMIITILF